MKEIAVLSALLLICVQSHSQVASDCIKLGEDADSRTMTNTCSKPVVVAWCHQASDAKGTLSSLCNGGDNRRLFRMSKILNPGQTNRNRYSLPVGSNISFGACFGSFGDFQRVGSAGHYACSLYGQLEGRVMSRSMAAAATELQACAKARSVAGSSEACDCENRSETVVTCSVSTKQELPASTFPGLVKTLLRNLLKCEPSEGDVCEIPPTHKAATATRG